MFQRIEDRGTVAALDGHAADHARDRAHRPHQAPERAQQSEKHQQADEIARQIARLVESGTDGVEQGPHRGRGEGDVAASAEHQRHRREQTRLRRSRVTQIGTPAVDPCNLRIERQDLAHVDGHTCDQHQEDDDVEPRVGHERGRQWTGNDQTAGSDRNGEDAHPPQAAARPRHRVRSPPLTAVPARVALPARRECAVILARPQSGSVSVASAGVTAGRGRRHHRTCGTSRRPNSAFVTQAEPRAESSRSGTAR